MQYKLSRTPGESGFTLLSLVLALLLSALLLTISVPKISAFAASGRALKSQAQQIKDLLESMVLQTGLAQSEGRFVYESGAYRAELLDPSGWRRIVEQTLSAPLRFHLPGQTAGEINFYPSGVNSPASLILRDSDSECVLRLSLRGRVTVRC